MVSSVARWGNSLAVRIPKPMAEGLALGEGSNVEVEVLHGCLVLRPMPERPRLDALLAAITPENLPGEAFDDGPIGDEGI